jgi:hypothetical protein
MGKSLASESHPSFAGVCYNVYGGRVPAILVSPFIAPGTTIRAGSGAHSITRPS